MKLSERLKSDVSWADYRDKIQARATLDRPTYNRLKTQVHFRLVEQLDFASLTELPKEALTGSIRASLEQITTAHHLPLNQKERADLIADLMDEILGLGPSKGWFRTRPCRTSWSTVMIRSSWSDGGYWKKPTSSSGTTITSCRSSTASFRRLGGG